MKYIGKRMLIILALILAFAPITFQSEGTYAYAAEAQKLNDLGLYAGTSSTRFEPDLGSALTREQGVAMLLKMFGMHAEAEAMSDAEADAALGKFKDAKDISTWAKKYIAFAVKNSLVIGTTTTTFAPKASLNGKAYCTMILRQLGLTPDYYTAPSILTERGGLTASQAAAFSNKVLIRDDLVGITYGSLSVKAADGQTLIAALVQSGVVDEHKAIATGLMDSELLAKAEAALAAYKAAPLTTLAEIAAAEELRIKAAELIAKVTDAAAKAAMEAALTEQKSKSDEARTRLIQTLTPNNTSGSNDDVDNDNDNDDDDTPSQVVSIIGLNSSTLYVNGNIDDNMLSFSVNPENSVVEAVYGNNIPFGGAITQWTPGSYNLSFVDFDEGSYTITITASKPGYTQASRTREVIIDRTAPIISFANVTPGTSKLNIAIAGSGRYYYLVYLDSASTPDESTIRAQGAALSKGTGVFTDFQEVTMTGLAGSKDYKVHLIVEDAAGNLSDVTSIAFEL